MTALTVVTFFGATTAFFAATVGLVQNDIKRVIAYSTCSQLGYMFAALGVGAYGAAIFHLFTHAFFKALLFLGAGSVIHAVSDEQDMRHMGGLRKHIPRTYWMMVDRHGRTDGVGIPGTIIGTAGFFSKDAIIESLYVGQNAFAGYAFWLTVVAALFTSFYSWRLIFMTFHGKPRASADVMSHIHESPNVMLVPLYVLAARCAVCRACVSHRLYRSATTRSGISTRIISTSGKRALPRPRQQDSGDLPRCSETGEMVALHHDGAWICCRLDFLHPVAGTCRLNWRGSIRGFTSSCSTSGISTSFTTGLSCAPPSGLDDFSGKQGDGRVIDGFGPDGISARVLDVTRGVVKLQSGYLYHYAFAMLIGAAALITWMMFGGVS